eukprot:g764.t1
MYKAGTLVLVVLLVLASKASSAKYCGNDKAAACQKKETSCKNDADCEGSDFCFDCGGTAPTPAPPSPTPKPTPAGGATNSTTGEVTNSSALTRALPLKQLHLIAPDGDLRGTDAITCVFSRAVIALGSNFNDNPDPSVLGVEPLLWKCNNVDQMKETGVPPVAGRTWWVTTSIIRFDPSQSWPTDLKCTVRVNPALKAFDHTPFVTETSKKLDFSTTSLSWSTSDVSSAIAEEATDGAWRRLRDDTSPECPADGQIHISFNTPVDPQAVQKALCLTTNPSELGKCEKPVDIPIKVSAPSATAQSPYVTGLTVSFAQPLAFDTEYALYLRAGVRLSNVSGPVAQPPRPVKLHGLYPFAFEWAHDVQVDSRHYALFVRHGLPYPYGDKGLQALTEAITVSPAPANLTLTQASKTMLWLHGDFMPLLADGSKAHYTFSADPAKVTSPSAKIIDNLGIPLTASTSGYSASDILPFAILPEPYNIRRQPSASASAAAPGSTSASMASGIGTHALEAIARGRHTVNLDPHLPGRPCEATKMSARPIATTVSAGINSMAAGTGGGLNVSSGEWGGIAAALVTKRLACSSTTGSTLVDMYFGDDAKGTTTTGTETHGPQKIGGDVETWSFSPELFASGSTSDSKTDADADTSTGAVFLRESDAHASWTADDCTTDASSHTCSLYTSADFAINVFSDGSCSGTNGGKHGDNQPATNVSCEQGQMTAWLSDHETAAPVAGATVRLFALAKHYGWVNQYQCPNTTGIPTEPRRYGCWAYDWEPKACPKVWPPVPFPTPAPPVPTPAPTGLPFVNPSWEPATVPCMELVTSTTTDADGVATFDAPDKRLNAGRCPSSYDPEYNGCDYSYVLVAQRTGSSAVQIMEDGLEWATPPKPPSLGREISMDMMVDRELFKTGETVYLKGFVRGYNELGDAIALPASDKANVTVSVRTPWGDGAVQPSDFAHGNATLDLGFGSFDFNVTIPENAKYGHEDISVQVEVTGEWDGVKLGGLVPSPYASASAAVTIADPREPTGVLALGIDYAYTKPQPTPSAAIGVFRASANSLGLKIATQTYSGDTVPDTQVDLSWSVDGWDCQRSGLRPASACAQLSASTSGSGVLALPTGTTDSAATAYSFALPVGLAAALDQDAAIASPGSGVASLTITVTWLDAARDLLQKKITVPVAASSWSAQLSVDPSTNANGGLIPGLPVEATVAVTLPADTNGAAPKSPPKVTIKLVGDSKGKGKGKGKATDAVVLLKATSTPALVRDDENDGDAAHDASATAFVAAGASTSVSSSGGRFTYQTVVMLPNGLPHTGLFNLTATFTDDAGTPCEVRMGLGDTIDQWHTAPLVGMPSGFAPTFDFSKASASSQATKTFAKGDTAVLRWRPFVGWGAGTDSASSTVNPARALLLWGNGLAPIKGDAQTLPRRRKLMPLTSKPSSPSTTGAAAGAAAGAVVTMLEGRHLRSGRGQRSAAAATTNRLWDADLEFEIGDECAQGCEVSAKIALPALPSAQAAELRQQLAAMDLPLSPLLDLSLPQTISLPAMQVPVSPPPAPSQQHQHQPDSSSSSPSPAPRILNISIDAPNSFAPGDNVEMSVQLGLVAASGDSGQDGDGDTDVEWVEGEAAVWVVNKAMVDQLPHSLPLASAMRCAANGHTAPMGSASTADTYGRLGAEAFSSAAVAIGTRRTGIDPFASWSLTTSSYYRTRPCYSELDEPDDAWLQQFRQCLTSGCGADYAAGSGQQQHGVCPPHPRPCSGPLH